MQRSIEPCASESSPLCLLVLQENIMQMPCMEGLQLELVSTMRHVKWLQRLCIQDHVPGLQLMCLTGDVLSH